MKPAAAIAAVLLVLSLPALANAGGRVHVRGYQRKDGTYVAPYWRGAPDGIASNNLSYRNRGAGPSTAPPRGLQVGPGGEELAQGEAYVPRSLTGLERSIHSVGPGETAIIRAPISSSGYRGAAAVERDARGRIRRSSSVRRRFLRSLGLTHTPAGCQVDHVIPLAKGGPDQAGNLQLLCGSALRAKEASELR